MEERSPRKYGPDKYITSSSILRGVNVIAFNPILRDPQAVGFQPVSVQESSEEVTAPDFSMTETYLLATVIVNKLLGKNTTSKERLRSIVRTYRESGRVQVPSKNEDLENLVVGVVDKLKYFKANESKIAGQIRDKDIEFLLSILKNESIEAKNLFELNKLTVKIGKGG